MKNFYKFNFTLDQSFQKYKITKDFLDPNFIEEFYNNFSIFSTEILSSTNSSKTSLEKLGIWVNHYSRGDFNEIHNHSQNEYQQKCNYTGILILEVGENENLVIFDETNTTSNTYKLNNGNCYVIRNDILHGLEIINDKLIALMFMIKL
jgi:hypothetical protein